MVIKGNHCPGVGRIGFVTRDQGEIPGHPEMEDQRRTRIEINEKEFSVPGRSGNLPTWERGKLIAVDCRPGPLDRGYGATDDGSVEEPANGLDFGEFRHGRYRWL